MSGATPVAQRSILGRAGTRGHPALAGARLVLRAFRAADIRHFRRWFADAEVVRYWWMRDVPWARWPLVAALILFTRGTLERGSIFWTIELDGKPIGHTNIRHIDRGAGHGTAAMFIGEKSAHSKGFGGEAIAVRNRYVFEQLGLHTIRASAFVENVATRRMLEKAGYRIVGRRQSDVSIAGVAHEVIEFELSRPVD
jgi:RimJ/RimL family protein N-acetyltransferase